MAKTATPAAKKATPKKEPVAKSFVKIPNDMREAIELLSTRIKVTPERVVESNMKQWVNANSDLLTDSEKEKFKRFVV